MATIISYGSQAKLPLDPLNTAVTIAGIPGAGAGLATAQVVLSPANPASFSSRVELNGSFSVNAPANSPFLYRSGAPEPIFTGPFSILRQQLISN